MSLQVETHGFMPMSILPIAVARLHVDKCCYATKAAGGCLMI